MTGPNVSRQPATTHPERHSPNLLPPAKISENDESINDCDKICQDDLASKHTSDSSAQSDIVRQIEQKLRTLEAKTQQSLLQALNSLDDRATAATDLPAENHICSLFLSHLLASGQAGTRYDF